ncbi:hypothetical protein DXG03_006271 [Asterophora parasitica]|uniref:Uncharacterized protein n=1 Tax=Asterophora parasitica TaxID=117018 RepID=A0A9P7G5V1_9AGAR|nr:hypothetical protein DXG03_006271 [Asterophora parasitica]
MLQMSDNDLLNYALQIASAQEALYDQGLSQFDESAFNASHGPGIRNGFVQLSQNKQAQVALLNQTLGDNATHCTFNFTLTNISTFTNLSQVLENVGTSAYIGAAQNITNGTDATTAASILSNNARSASWVSSAVNGVEPWDGPFDANPFDATSSASLTVPPPTTAGQNATYIFSNSTAGTPLFAVFFHGLNKTFVPLNNDTATIPNNLTGIVYTAVTNSSSVADDNTTVAGPTFLDLSYPFNTTSSSSGGAGGGTTSSASSTPVSTTSFTSSGTETTSGGASPSLTTVTV